MDEGVLRFDPFCRLNSVWSRKSATKQTIPARKGSPKVDICRGPRHGTGILVLRICGCYARLALVVFARARMCIYIVSFPVSPTGVKYEL